MCIKLTETVTWNLRLTRKIKNSGGGFGKAGKQAQNKKKGNNTRRRRGTCGVPAWEPIRSGCFSAACLVLLVSAPIRLIMATLKTAAAVWSCDILERGPTGPIKSGGAGGETQFSSVVSRLFLLFLSSCDDSVILLSQQQPLHSHSSEKHFFYFYDNHKASSLLPCSNLLFTPDCAWCVWR